MFKSDFIERFSYVHPAMPLLLWGAVVIYCLTVNIADDISTPRSVVSYAAIGLAVWTLAEYLLHRFIFHFTPHSPFQERIAFMIHGVHHDDPADERRLLMPPVAGMVIASVFWVLFTAILGPVNVRPFFGGFIIGYLIYDYTHFAVHYFNPKSPLFKKLKHQHMLHHFATPDKRFGVSSPFWDYIFGTRG